MLHDEYVCLNLAFGCVWGFASPKKTSGVRGLALLGWIPTPVVRCWFSTDASRTSRQTLPSLDGRSTPNPDSHPKGRRVPGQGVYGNAWCRAQLRTAAHSCDALKDRDSPGGLFWVP